MTIDSNNSKSQESLRILFVVPYVPSRIRVRPYEFIRSLLRGGHRVTVATLWTSQDEKRSLQELQEEGAKVVAARLNRSRSALNCLQAFQRGLPLQGMFSWQPDLSRRLGLLLENEKFDVVHVEHLRGALYGLKIRELLARPVCAERLYQDTQPVFVWDSVDCIGRLFSQAVEHSRSLKGRIMGRIDLKRTVRCEAWLVNQFDQVLVTSDIDRAALITQSEEVFGGAIRESDLQVIPNGVDLQFFKPGEDSRNSNGLVFSGKMSYHANVTAALFLGQEILPRLVTSRPEVKLVIAGKDPSRKIRALDPKGRFRKVRRSNGDGHVEVTGTVADIRPFLKQASLALAPIVYGAGIQNKVLEAMACGTPVVASPEAALPLQARPGEEIEVAQNTEEFVGKILHLLADKARWNHYSTAGRRYVEDRHNWDRMGADLVQTYRHCLEDSRPASLNRIDSVGKRRIDNSTPRQTIPL